MRCVYLAGCYRDSRGEWFVHQNIEKSKEIARQIWKMGAAVIAPCANTAMFGGTDVPDSVWLRGDLEIVRRCDAVVVCPGSEKSAGVAGEIGQAHALAMPVFHWPDDLARLTEFIRNAPREVVGA